MMRALTAVVISFATLFCLVVMAFLWAVFSKAGRGDPLSLGLLVVFGAFIAGMWLAFSRRWHIIAWALAALPVVLAGGLLSQLKLRYF
jgi:hypothetical protein